MLKVNMRIDTRKSFGPCYLRWNDYVAIWWLICTYLYCIEPAGIYLKYQSTRLDISMWQPSKLGTWANSWHLDEIRKLLCLPPRYRLLGCRFAHDQSPFGFVGIWLLSRKKNRSHLRLKTFHYVTSYSSYQCWSVASLSSSLYDYKCINTVHI